MSAAVSYTKFENQVIHKFRNNLNHAESVEDAKKFFNYTMLELMQKVFDGQLTIEYEDIQLGLYAEKPFIISEALRQKDEFDHVWSTSDLPSIVARLATPALHRFNHLKANPEKTKSKINRH